MHNDISQNLVSVEYRDNERIQILKINSITREAVDAFAELIQTEIIDKELSSLQIIYDVRNVGGMVTPYFVKQVQGFGSHKVIVNGQGRIAAVISTELFRVMINPLVRFVMRNNLKLTIQFFSDFDQAIKWVSEYEE